jgi:serine/threonine protein kinase
MDPRFFYLGISRFFHPHPFANLASRDGTGRALPCDVRATLRSSASQATLGRYRQLERIGSGGTAEVFTAVLPGMAGFEKRVVLKRLHSRHQGDSDYETLFVEEAKRAAAVQHPNVVQTFELQRDAKTQALFMVLEHVDGVDLRQLLRTQSAPLPVELIVWIGTKVLQALSHLDEMGQFVHCDVTPENVFLSLQGDVKLGDLGMASQGDPNQGPFAGKVLGKVPYMSPEQAAGKRIDARTDLFSLGVLLWEAAAGRRLFKGRTVVETAAQIRNGHRPSLAPINPSVPQSLDELILQALSVNRDARPDSAEDMRLSLLEVLEALAPTKNEAQYRAWLGRLVASTRNQPPDVSAPIEPPSTGAGASTFVSVAAADDVDIPPPVHQSAAGLTDDLGTSARVGPPPARAGAVEPFRLDSHPVAEDLRIPMFGRPASVETHEIIRTQAGWDVQPTGANRIWVRAGRSVWGPFATNTTVTRLLRLAPRSLQRVSLSSDKLNWLPLLKIVADKGLSLVAEDAHFPNAALRTRLEDVDLTCVLGELARTSATGRLVVVRESSEGPERRDIEIREGQLVAVHCNRSSLAAAAASLLQRSTSDVPPRMQMEADLGEMLGWSSGRIFFDDSHSPQADALRPLCWRLPSRVLRARGQAQLRGDLAPHWQIPLQRTVDFDRIVDRMGLLGTETESLTELGDGRSLALALGAEPARFPLALAYVLIELGVLTAIDGQHVSRGLQHLR